MSPQLSRGFWNSMEDLGIEEAWVIAPVEGHYPVADNVTVSNLEFFLGAKR